MGERQPVIPRGLATEDLRDAAAHDATEAGVATAQRFIDAVAQAFTLIGAQPGVGSPRNAIELEWPGLRSYAIERFPYLIFSVEQGDHLDVLRVLHAHRERPRQLAGSFSRRMSLR